MTDATVRLIGRKVHIVRRQSECHWCLDHVAHTVLKPARSWERELRWRVLGDPSALAALRQIVTDHGLLDRLHGVRDDEVLQHVSHLLEIGHLTAIECRPRPRLATASPVAEAPPELVAPPRAAEKKIKTWIEIELIDEQGDPVPFERYAIVLPDGTKTGGSLDKKGLARIDEIDPGGTCQISFPDIDGREWEGA